ncbi:hypothetical protein JOD78_001382 [Herbaspirillum sp. 1130]|nr:hypothetical protein [Herbaspirillum sp. 1130]
MDKLSSDAIHPFAYWLSFKLLKNLALAASTRLGSPDSGKISAALRGLAYAQIAFFQAIKIGLCYSTGAGGGIPVSYPIQ